MKEAITFPGLCASTETRDSHLFSGLPLSLLW